MPTARKDIVRIGDGGVYHCHTRCVRRAYLCGRDENSGRNFDHRRDWIVERMRYLTESFALRVVSYAVMENHYHVVVRVMPDLVENLSAREVARRWLRVFTGRHDPDSVAAEPDEEAIERWAGEEDWVAEKRARLMDLSWFMRSLNEWIARRANREDGCTGRFWEGRFKSQLLADPGAILAGAVYVDLNPVRAGVAQTPEESRYTGIKARIDGREGRRRVLKAEELGIVEKEKREAREWSLRDEWLQPLGGGDPDVFLPGVTEETYLRLVDLTGRMVREGKKGRIPEECAPILERLDLDLENWVDNVEGLGGMFRRMVGKIESLQARAEQVKKSWFQGRKASRRLFRSEGRKAA